MILFSEKKSESYRVSLEYVIYLQRFPDMNAIQIQIHQLPNQTSLWTRLVIEKFWMFL